MKNDIKWAIFIIIIVLIIVASIVMIIIINNENKIEQEISTIQNKKDNLDNPKSLDTLILSNFKVIKEKTQTKIICKITNKFSGDVDIPFIKAKIKDRNGRIITEIITYLGKVRGNSNREFVMTTQDDISNIYDIQFTK